MKKEPKYYERMAKHEIESVLRKDWKTFLRCLAVIVLLFIFGYFLTSCSEDNEPAQETHELYWQTRHDAIPDQFKGYWSSISDKTTPVLNVTDKFVMTAHFSINREQDNIVKVNDSILHLYQNGKFFVLAFGVNGTMTITAFNDCYDTVVPFNPEPIDTTQPEPQEPVFN